MGKRIAKAIGLAWPPLGVFEAPSRHATRGENIVKGEVDGTRYNIYVVSMNARELKRWLATKGCTFENHAGGSGHVTVRLGERVSQLPMHGKNKELGTGLVQKILKDLGLKG